jgi:hypothetical protein
VPLPVDAEALRKSAAIGREVAALLDTEAGAVGVTAGRIRAELKTIGVICRTGGGQLNAAAGKLDVTARWGIAGKGGVCMPSTGKEHGAAHRCALAAGGRPGRELPGG